MSPSPISAPAEDANRRWPNLSSDGKTQSREWLAVLECASRRPNLDRLSTLVQNPFNWSLLLQRAESHGVIPQVSERLQDLGSSLVPLEIRNDLRELQRAQTAFTLRLTAELFRVLERFVDAGIDILVTKGPALSVRCYGDPGMRQYGDLDIVVRDRDIQRSTEAMLDIGYEPRVPLPAIRAKRIPGEYAFRQTITDVLVEFHTERTFRYHPRSLQIEKLFERGASLPIDGREVTVLSLEDELVLICVHGAKHFWERLMWIADVAALISRQQLDWDRAIVVAREVGAERILRLGLSLASDILGAELPSHLEVSIRSDRIVSKLAGQVTSHLDSYELHEIGILQRAAFRVRMPGGLIAGASYLLRLSLSPTEEDWTTGKEGSRPAFVDALSRPIRLAKKHSRRSSS